MVLTALVFSAGNEWLPSAQSSRIVVSCTWIVLLVVTSTYHGNLIASLATKPVKLPFTTLNEVAMDTQYTVLIRPDSSQRTLLEVGIQETCAGLELARDLC